MPTDIILDNNGGEWITLTAAVVQAAAADFVLDHPGRRASGRGYRRALVHDHHDGLTINFNGDYPGGLTLNAVAKISPRREENNAPISPVAAAASARIGIPELHIDGGIRFLWDHGRRVGASATEEVSLQQKLLELQVAIDELKAKVAALGG